MISTKKLIKMARKWQKFAAASRRRVSWPRTNMADRGHVFIYANDGKRFTISLSYLKSEIIQELFRMAEEEFGLTSDGPITLPCDSILMEYALSVLQRHVTEDLKKAFILSFAECRSSSATLRLHEDHAKQQLLVC
ncbi:hypothetical protein RND81_09G145300 [Saponaria officinalis]|uniref:Uncharacterized protein n=1 Tax=Saponaria officinalis TaxID=3572 RepID=A0AAW1ILW1_SAPOF